VSWARVPGATRYELVSTLSGRPQRILRTRASAATLRRVPLTARGRISVRAVATLRQGAPVSARLRAAAPESTRFGALPKAPRIR
jgi:hypothetical protein